MYPRRAKWPENGLEIVSGGHPEGTRPQPRARALFDACGREIDNQTSHQTTKGTGTMSNIDMSKDNAPGETNAPAPGTNETPAPAPGQTQGETARLLAALAKVEAKAKGKPDAIGGTDAEAPAGKPGGKPPPAAPWLLSLAQVAEAVGRSYHEVDRWNKRGLMPPPVYLPSGRGTGGRKSPSFKAAEILAWIEAGCPNRKAWQAMKAP